VLWVVHVSTCSLGSNRLARAVAASGVPLVALGLGTVWKWRWGARMRMLHDFLVTVPDRQLVVFSDSADVIPVPAASSQLIASR